MMVLFTECDGNLIFDLHKFSKSQNNIKEASVVQSFKTKSFDFEYWSQSWLASARLIFIIYKVCARISKKEKTDKKHEEAHHRRRDADGEL